MARLCLKSACITLTSGRSGITSACLSPARRDRVGFETTPSTPPRKRAGLTLLELILAMSLAALIVYAIGMALRLNLYTLDVRRTNVEEAQLARALLRMMADDLRSAVQHYEQDLSGVEQMIGGAGTGAAEQDDAGGLDAAIDAAAGGAGAGDANRQTGTDGTGQPGSASSGSLDGGEMTADTDLMETSPYVENIAESVEPPPLAGLYGNAYELQIDISRLPRVDQYQTLVTDGYSLNDIPSDVKTVTYFLQSARMDTGVSAVRQGTQPLASADANLGGLVRRELDRAVTQWAAVNGNLEGLRDAGTLLAPEVLGLEFSYFDGYQWLTEWDSSAMGGLPVAVRIVLVVAQRGGQRNVIGDEQMASELAAGGLAYELLVPLPTAEPIAQEEQDLGQSGMEELGL